MQQENYKKEASAMEGRERDEYVLLKQFVGCSLEPAMMIVTELMKGDTLQRYLWNMRPKRLELDFALRLALGNLLLSEDRTCIKLADFGLAREEVLGGMTCEAGTYRWMAPEIYSRDPLPIGAKKHYDHKVDVYSFSIVLWEILTNKAPFKGRDNVTAAYAAAKAS
ncbi:serine/threonine-protein kinase HT1-like isoform X3 [Gossypium australe]|uniref:Serine/threonine-protein kinase HT1-like isoform X3 n=1 Tax=Gossypium australe TaxID=47621 RepID=A0A5B6VYG9_9ROSI|nr:serine/threonine-protein kinase HT1-like isoform X3 [Gossypium australe]